MSTKKRPIGVTVLAILAAITGVLAFIYALQSMALLPYFIGPFVVINFNLWSAIMWGLMTWVWFWLVQMLWRADPEAWQFLVIVTVFNLVIDFTYLVGRAEWSDVSLSFIVNALILFYITLPKVRQAFGQK